MLSAAGYEKEFSFMFEQKLCFFMFPAFDKAILSAVCE